ncbi:MAG: RNB domain-containing ribonuclease [Armatimonadetes bacterium]|nr:RNB domain-containing ribonuclease [Armatimonadota bacterium]
MDDWGLLTGSSPDSLQQLKGIAEPAQSTDPGVVDLRKMLWCSIDNDDSRDLDQLTVAEELPNGDVKIYVAIADVDALVPKGSPLDRDAFHNTTSVYTTGKIFSMLPEKLSTDLTSLNPGVDRLAVVTEYTVGKDGEIKSSNIYRAMVHNHAKMAYNSVSPWLEGKGPLPQPAADVKGMDDQLRIQDQAAQKLRERRHENGALTLETLEPKAVIQDGKVLNMYVEEKNRARELIEDIMVAANGVAARFLNEKGFPTFMRVVRTPYNWGGILQAAKEVGETLPDEPDSAALEKFLAKQKVKDPLHFPDLSVTVVKCLGRGEYAVQQPGEEPIGHFGLAVKDYSHSTAPNRRYPDIITQRLIKAALAGKPCPYTVSELDQGAEQCTEQEHIADKVERHLRKSAAALYLSDKIGQRFDALVTGVNEKGTWVRTLKPPTEGRLVHGEEGAKVGAKLRVKLIDVDVEKGHIDFVRTGGKG